MHLVPGRARVVLRSAPGGADDSKTPDREETHNLLSVGIARRLSGRRFAAAVVADFKLIEGGFR